MKSILMLIAMIFLHCYADYYIQGILANMKQKSWWEKSIKDLKNTKYKNDYKAALAAHSIEWAFVVMIPEFITAMVMLSEKPVNYLLSVFFFTIFFIVNAYIHYRVDDAKANRNTINLIEDQVCHLVQIVSTWIFWTIVIGW